MNSTLHAWQSSLSRHPAECSSWEGCLLSNYATDNSACSVNECWAALCSLWWCAEEAASRRGRQAGLTYWWKRLPLLCGWTWTAWRHRQREDDDQTELHLKHKQPLLNFHPSSCYKVPHKAPLRTHNVSPSSLQSQLTSCCRWRKTPAWHCQYKLSWSTSVC